MLNESVFGVIPNVRVKGKAATSVADILSRMQREQPVISSNVGIPEIDTLILLDRQNQTVSDLKDFVKKLNSLPEMTRHTNLAQHLSTFTTKTTFLSRLTIEQTLVEGQSYDICFEYIEEMIHKQEPFISILRLLVLFSITNGGLPKKHFDYLSPNDIAYVFSGYAPLTIRLVQHALRAGWRSIEEIVRLLPGPHSERKQEGFVERSPPDAQPEAPLNHDTSPLLGVLSHIRVKSPRCFEQILMWQAQATREEVKSVLIT